MQRLRKPISPSFGSTSRIDDSSLSHLRSKGSSSLRAYCRTASKRTDSSSESSTVCGTRDIVRFPPAKLRFKRRRIPPQGQPRIRRVMRCANKYSGRLTLASTNRQIGMPCPGEAWVCVRPHWSSPRLARSAPTPTRKGGRHETFDNGSPIEECLSDVPGYDPYDQHYEFQTWRVRDRKTKRRNR